MPGGAGRCLSGAARGRSAHCVCGSARCAASRCLLEGAWGDLPHEFCTIYQFSVRFGDRDRGDRGQMPRPTAPTHTPQLAQSRKAVAKSRTTHSLTHRTHTSERNDRASRSWTGPELLRSLGWYSRSFGLAAGGKVAHHVGGQHADWHEEPYPVDDHPKVHIKEVEGGQWGETLANAHGLHV